MDDAAQKFRSLARQSPALSAATANRQRKSNYKVPLERTSEAWRSHPVAIDRQSCGGLSSHLYHEFQPMQGDSAVSVADWNGNQPHPAILVCRSGNLYVQRKAALMLDRVSTETFHFRT